MNGQDKEMLFRSVFRIQNRALRAEADLEAAIQLLKNADAEVNAWKYQAESLRMSLDEAHSEIDLVSEMTPRHISHVGLPARVRKLAGLFRPPPINPIYYIQNMSIDALKIMVDAYNRNHVSPPPDLVAELKKREPL